MPGFPRLLLARVLIGFANWMNRLAVGWLVLDGTGSTFLTALSFAAQTAPGMVAAPLAGALCDRHDRRWILAASAAARAAVMVCVGISVAVDGGVWALIGLVAVGGAFHSFDQPATQALVTDLVGGDDAMGGIALQSVVTRAVGVLGALSSGLLLDTVAAQAVFFGAAGVLAVSCLILLGVPTPAHRDRTPAPGPRLSIGADIVDGLRVMARLPAVRALLLLAVVVEILAFSYQSVLPVVARQVLHVGPVGLGLLTTMAGVGALVGSLALVAVAGSRRRGRLLLGTCWLFGVGILAFSASDAFPLSLVIVAGLGAMAASFDSLQWALLQAHVPDRMRGRAVGAWVFAIGFGWVGHLALGAVGGWLGVQAALAIHGGLVVVAALVAFTASGLRRL